MKKYICNLPVTVCGFLCNDLSFVLFDWQTVLDGFQGEIAMSIF